MILNTTIDLVNIFLLCFKRCYYSVNYCFHLFLQLFDIYVLVCKRREAIARKSSLRKRKREEENTYEMKQKVRKVDKDELTFRADIECRLVSK